ncbi:MAG: helix-turn-helix domain-containing protein [Elusimicrobia bacterium]|nr:helix-turn-helix domain-containing protein [Elusimicrobiota bacterium]
MEKKKYLTIPQLAKILGITRIAVYKKVKSGEIKSIRIGRNFAIPVEEDVSGETLSKEDKRSIDKAVKKTVREYGEVLKKLGKE